MGADCHANCSGEEDAQRVSSQQIARAFDRQNADLSANADLWPKPSPITLRLLDMLQDVAASRPTLLEIGCGTGAASVRLAEQGAARVTGIDLSPASVGIAVRRAANAALDPAVITFEVGDGASSVLEPHDWVLLDRVICCYPNVTGLLANATSAAGKRIAFAVPESRGWRGMVSTVVLGAENLWNNTFRRATCPGYVHDLGMIESILADAGFHLINQTHRGLWYAAVFDRFT